MLRNVVMLVGLIVAVGAVPGVLTYVRTGSRSPLAHICSKDSLLCSQAHTSILTSERRACGITVDIDAISTCGASPAGPKGTMILFETLGEEHQDCQNTIALLLSTQLHRPQRRGNDVARYG